MAQTPTPSAPVSQDATFTPGTPTTPAPAPGAGPVRRRGSRWRLFLSYRAGVVALAFLALLVLVAIFAPVLAPKDPAVQDLGASLVPPSAEYPLGTDSFGRDVLSRLIFASRVTLLAVLQAVAMAAAIGIPLGLLAGYVGKAVDAILSRISDGLMSLPPLILAIAIVGILGPGLTTVMFALGIVLAPAMFRLARAAGQSVSTETYVEACRAVGLSPWRILWRHVLPNASSPLLVQLTFSASVVVMAEASLSFLGLGVRPPGASWGAMLRGAFDYVYDAPFAMIPPAVMIVLTVLSLSILGDALRDVLEGKAVIRVKKGKNAPAATK